MAGQIFYNISITLLYSSNPLVVFSYAPFLTTIVDVSFDSLVDSLVTLLQVDVLATAG